ncbi:MAG: septum formation inhibitor Maf [Betaproteobacteria bacterium]|nr:septum formation inhibitor Maf [Betaproteobacteria bacterium]
MDKPRLVLASTSRYRRELLQRLRLAFEIAAPHVKETAREGEAPEETAARLAFAKARAVAARFPQALIIGCDQVAALDGTQLGKPGDHTAAARQLRMMRGRSVLFHTALCLLNAASGRAQTATVPVTVRLRRYTDAQIERYLALERPYDCAGAAKVEGLGIALIESMAGEDPNALTGLPLIKLVEMLRNEGIEVL